MAAAPSAPLVFVVVLNHNGWEDTRECLDSLAALEYDNHRVVVVDNASADGSEELIRARYPDVPVLQTGANVGFSRGNNVGIRFALEHGADLVWLLNNDTTVEPGALTALVAKAEGNPAAGIIGSVLYFHGDPARIQAWGGGTFTRLTGIAACAMEPRPAGELDFITGASMLLRREALEDIGLLDERFFLYLEDTDLCHRARERGWSLAVAEGSVVYHKVGQTAKAGHEERSLEADRVHVKSSGIFLGKHAGPWILVAAPLRLAGIVWRRAMRRQFRATPMLVAQFLTGLWRGRTRGPLRGGSRRGGPGRRRARRARGSRACAR